jgi:hypothetical protein
MKKLFMLLTFVVGISISCWSNNGINLLSQDLKSSKGVSYKKNLRVPWEWRNFEVTFYFSCGVHWAGEVRVWSNHQFITTAEFNAAWRLKNYVLCGVWVPD